MAENLSKPPTNRPSPKELRGKLRKPSTDHLPNLNFVSSDPDRLLASSTHMKQKKSSKRSKRQEKHSSSQDSIKYTIKNGVPILR